MCITAKNVFVVFLSPFLINRRNQKYQKTDLHNIRVLQATRLYAWSIRLLSSVLTKNVFHDTPKWIF